MKQTVTVDMVDNQPPTIDVVACTLPVGITCAPYSAGSWTPSNDSVVPICTDDSPGVECSEAVTYTTEGEHTVPPFTAKDIANKVASASFGSVKIDRTTPVPAVTMTSGGQNYAGGPAWAKGDVHITRTCHDPAPGVGVTPSGVQSCALSPVTNPVTQEGENTVEVTAIDFTGNRATTTVPINIDLTDPVIAVDTGTYKSGEWTKDNVSVDFTCSDAHSGLNPQATSCADGTFATHGIHEGRARATDFAGRTAESKVAVWIDKVAPTLVLAATTTDGEPYGGGAWVNQRVTVTSTCTDVGSGITEGNCPSAKLYTEGVHTAAESVTDRVGHTTEASLGPILVDLSPPTIIADTGDYIPGAWTNQPVSVTFTCEDQAALSGVASCSEAYTIETGVETVHGKAVDRAGNETPTKLLVMVDTEPPSLEATLFSGGDVYTPETWTNEPVRIEFTCSDDASELAAECPGDITLSDTAENQSVTRSIQDVAGNETTLTIDDIDIDRNDPVVAFDGNLDSYSILDQVQLSCTATDGLFSAAERDAGTADDFERHMTNYINHVERTRSRAWFTNHDAAILTAIAEALLAAPRA